MESIHQENITLLIEIDSEFAKKQQKYSVFIPVEDHSKVDLVKLMDKVEEQNCLNFTNLQVFFVNLTTQTKDFLGLYPFHEEEIMLTFSQNMVNLYCRQFQNEQSKNENKGTTCTAKSRRNVQQRTISQVQHLIKVFESEKQKIKEGNKEQAFKLKDIAVELDISKKSLEEYFRVVKKGQKLGFNFEMFENQKIGVLRGYIKEKSKQFDAETVEDFNNIDKYFF